MRRAAALAAAAAIAGCGSGDKPPSAALAWDGRPQAFNPRGLPRDGVVVGKVRNSGDRDLHLAAATLVVRDARGRRLRASAGFTSVFAHGLFGALQQPKRLPRLELRRLGRIVDLAPGASAPFYAAWHLGPGASGPVTVDYGAGALAVPAATRFTAP